MKLTAKTLFVGAALALAAFPAAADDYNLSYLSNSSLFGITPLQDGSTDLQRSTTEQFDPVRGQSIVNRPRPDYDQLPIDVGSFQIFPTATIGGTYNSNIFAQQDGKVGDSIWEIDPAVSVVSNWGTDAVALTAIGGFHFYGLNDGQNYDNGAIQAEGRLDLAEQTWLAATAGYQRVTELREAPSTPGNGAGPSEYDLWTMTAEAYRGVGLLKAKLDYSVNYFNYNPVDLIGGGTINQEGRDRVENALNSQVSYDVTENFKPFVRVGVNDRDYVANDLRTSDGYNVDVGAKMDFGGIVTAEAYVGFLAQDYYNFTSGQVGAPDFGGDILWNVTELTSIEFQQNRSIEETDVNGIDDPTAAPDYIATSSILTITHELQRDILLQFSETYSNLDFQNIGRTDNEYDSEIGVRYFINRNLYADATYDYLDRTTNAAGQNFNSNIVFIRLGYKY